MTRLDAILGRLTRNPLYDGFGDVAWLVSIIQATKEEAIAFLQKIEGNE